MQTVLGIFVMNKQIFTTSKMFFMLFSCRRKSFLWFFFLVIIFSPRFTAAQWIQTGFSSDSKVNSIVVNESDIYAATEEGKIFVSHNEGSSWIEASSGLSGSAVTSLAVNESGIFSGTFNHGIFIYNNDEDQWNSVNTGNLNNRIVSLYTNDSIVMAGGFYDGILQSTDYGSTWAEKNYVNYYYGNSNYALRNFTVSAFAIIDTNFYAGTNYQGVFYTSDIDSGWESINNGLYRRPNNWFFHSLINKENVIYAGTNYGVYQSSDFGSNWNSMNSGLSEHSVRTLSISDTCIYAGTDAGVFFFGDNTTAWYQVKGGLENRIICSLAKFGNFLYAGTNSGEIWKISFSEISSIRKQPSAGIFDLTNHPNPFSESTTIRFHLEKSSHVRLRIFDLIGNEVITLVEGQKDKGRHEIVYNNPHLKSGVYFYSLETNYGEKICKKMVVK
jgi:photosystem II stability/assembly factor-like uncharacterized protein